MTKNLNNVLSICRLLVVASPLFLIGMLFWAYQLDLKSIASHGDVEFPSRFWWWMFYAAAALGYLGCLGLAAALESRTVFNQAS